MEGFTTAIISSGNCYLFYLCSRDERGLSMMDGTSVLMKFNDLFEIEKYIEVAYLEHRERQQAYFQIQFIEVTVGSIENQSIKTEISLQFAKNARREHDREHSDSINKRQPVYYSNLKGSPQHLGYMRKKGNLS